MIAVFVEWNVVGRRVVPQSPRIVVPLDWTFAPDVFPQLPQNIATEIPIRGGRNSLCRMTSVSKKETNKLTLI
jgi:hypothetical protein